MEEQGEVGGRQLKASIHVGGAVLFHSSSQERNTSPVRSLYWVILITPRVHFASFYSSEDGKGGRKTGSGEEERKVGRE